MAGVVEWGQSAWVPEEWRHIDQPPVFLGAFRGGDEVVTLSGDFVTTLGVFGVGPTAASVFILDLVDALCEQRGGVTIDVDLVSRPGMRTTELAALIDGFESQLLGEGRWLLSVGRGPHLREWAGLLIGSNLDYQLDFAGLRFAERDASVVLLAGQEAVVHAAWAVVEAVAARSGTELKPFGWDL